MLSNYSSAFLRSPEKRVHHSPEAVEFLHYARFFGAWRGLDEVPPVEMYSERESAVWKAEFKANITVRGGTKACMQEALLKEP